MDSLLQIRISKELKNKFYEIAEQNGTDGSNLIRGWIMYYIREHEKKGNKSKAEKIEKLYEAGYALKQKMGGFKAAKLKAWELNNLITNDDLDKFIESIMKLHVENDMPMPNEILNTRDDASYAQAFIMGMLGEKN